MIRSFHRGINTHIIIEYPFTNDDRETLVFELAKKASSYSIEFGRIYTLNTVVVDLLYSKLYSEKININFITHTRKLYTYLKKMGIKSQFISLVQEYVVHTNGIDVVLIGGSANSSDKIIEIMKGIHLQNLSLVIVQHISGSKKVFFDKILQEYTNYKVKYVKDKEVIKKGTIYLAPPNKHLKIDNGIFQLTNEEEYNYAKPSISLSYESFSNFYKEKLLVIQECGFINDGVDKIKILKSNNSLFVIQNPSECSATSMVNSAIELSLHDYIFTHVDIVAYINFINKNASKEVWVEYLIYTIYKRYGYDFRMYHRDTLQRRLDIFILKHGVNNIKDAVGIILFDQRAFKSFFLEISINVTEFFRKPLSFENTLHIVNEKYKKKNNVKIWSAGCSSGEEVYSLAILLESLGNLDKSIIYATDYNKVILDEAKNALYPIKSLLQAEKNLMQMNTSMNFEDYIEQNNHYFKINEKIKKKVLFFQHNLVTDTSFNEFDIIICKNVLIYFDENLQKKVFQLFYNSLRVGGFLALGESEGLSENFVNKFQKCSENCKIFKKVA